MVDVRGDVLRPHTAQHQLQWRQIKIKKMSSFKKNENIYNKEDEPYYEAGPPDPLNFYV